MEYELTRSRDHRRLYDIEGVGTLGFDGFLGRRAIARAGATDWSFDRGGFWRTTINAFDAGGAVVGSFDPRALRRGGSLRWGDRDLALQPASAWKERYALVEQGVELAVLDDKSWGKRPLKITVNEPGLVEPGLMLFAAFAVRQLADDASATAGGAAAVAATG